MKMRIFGGTLNSLTLLSCCTPSDRNLILNETEKPVRIEKYHPRSVHAPKSVSQSKSSDKDSELLTRMKTFISHTSGHRNISASEVASDTQKSPIFCGLNSPTLFSDEDEEKFDKSDIVYQPLNLRLPKDDKNWSSNIPQIHGDISRVPTKTGRQQLKLGKTHGSLRATRSTSGITELKNYQTPHLPPLDDIFNQVPNAKFSSHMRVRSDSVVNQRIRTALDEKEKLTQRLKIIEDDIHRKSMCLSSRPSSRASRRDSIFPFASDPISQHPLKSAPTRPFTQPTGRSFSLSSQSARPDRGEPIPPLPLILHTSIHTRGRSLSRVSSWLTTTSHNDCARLSSITNMPRPVTEREGFYNCIGSSQLSTGTTLSTSDYNSDQPTLYTSHESSPASRSEISGFGGTEFYNYCSKTTEISKKKIEFIPEKKEEPFVWEESNFGIAF